MFTVIACFQIEGFHRWPEAPPHVAFLRANHRHLFHVEMEKKVEHADRAVEIITLRQEGLQTLTERFGGPPCQFDIRSCEQIADALLSELALYRCKVLEDGENGGIAYASNALAND